MNKINYPLPDNEVQRFVDEIENKLLTKPKFQFSLDSIWRNDIPHEPGVYAVFEKGEFIYIGETADLRDRMTDLRRTYNHSLRNKLGKLRLEGVKVKNKYTDEIELALDNYMSNHLEISYCALNFGRKEVESMIFEKNKNQLINSTSKRGKKK